MPGQIGTVGEYRAEGDEAGDGPETFVDYGGSIEGGEADNGWTDHFSAPGDDSPPLPGDDSFAVDKDPDGEDSSSIAYSDNTERKSLPGEVRRYARDQNGNQVSELYLQRDKSITLTQESGASVTIAASGEITINNGNGAVVTLGVDGSIQLSGTSVSLQTGQDLGVFLTTLHAGVTAWVPVPNDGGAALKTALGAWLAQTPPGP